MEKSNEKVRLDKISIDPTQPRTLKDMASIKSLAANMREIGQINPIEIDAEGMIVTGFSRYEAAKLLGWNTIAAKVVKRDKNTLLRQVSENVVRNALEPMDLAVALQRLILTSSRKDVARAMGWSDQTLRVHLHLLEVTDPELLKLLKDKTVSFRVIVMVNGCTEPKVREAAIGWVKSGLARQWVVVSAAIAYLRITGDFETCDSVLKEAKGRKMNENDTSAKFREITPSVAKHFSKNLSKGQRLIGAMSALSLALKDVKLEDVAPIHYGRLLTTWTILEKQMPKFTKQLALNEPKK